MLNNFVTHGLAMVVGVLIMAVALQFGMHNTHTTRDLFAETKDSIFYVGYVESINGTGFAISPDVIMTNSHVIGSKVIGDEIKITSSDNTEYLGTVILDDFNTDIALIRMGEDFTSKNYRPLSLCDQSITTKIGDDVVAIGHPWGNKWSISKGIMVAKDRQVGPQNHSPYIQTDAKIQEGNSGGPLLSLDHGCVVGLTSLLGKKMERARSPVPVLVSKTGYGFALDSLYILKHFPSLVRDGAIAQFNIGVKLKGRNDLTITTVKKGSHAKKHGILKGDKIISVNGVKIKSIPDLFRVSGSLVNNQEVELMVERDGEMYVAHITNTINDKIKKAYKTIDIAMK